LCESLSVSVSQCVCNVCLYICVCAESGGLDDPYGILFAPDGDFYVCSRNTDEVLRYDGTTGTFIDVFVSEGSGGLDAPNELVFGPDGNLYVSSSGTDAVLRYDGTTGAFIDEFVPSGSGGLEGVFSILFGPDDNLYAVSFNTDQILRYNGTTGAFLDVFVISGSGGLDGPVAIIFFTRGSEGSSGCSIAPANTATLPGEMLLLLMIPAFIFIRRKIKKSNIYYQI